MRIKVATGAVDGAVPEEAVVGRGCGVAMGGMVDGQVEDYYAVASSGVGVGVGRCSGGSGGVGVAVPSEVIAGGGCGIATGGVVDGEM